MNLLDAHSGGFQALQHVADVAGRAGEAAQPVARAAERGMKVVLIPASHPLHLERHQGADALAQARGDLRARERALAAGVDRAVLVEPVAWCPGPAFRCPQDDEPVQVGDHPQIPVRLVQRRRRVDAPIAGEGIEYRREPHA
jgi:hypothetical protein